MASPASIALVQGVRGDPYAPTPEDRLRSQHLIVAWDAYRGAFHSGNPQWPLLWDVGKEPNPNVIINRCGPAADTDVAWLFGESVGIAVKDLPKQAQEYVDQVWGVSSDDSSDDDKMALLQELALNGAVTGHSYLKLDWDAGAMDYPTLVVLDSTQVRVQTAPHNIKVVTCYIIEYQIPDEKNPNGGMATFRQTVELHDADGQQKRTGKSDPDDYWIITDYLKPAESMTYIQQGEPSKWPYSWAPIQDCAHLVAPNRYYGRPRLSRDLIHINEAICTVASNVNKIGLRHGHPLLYTIKTGANQRSLRYQPGTVMEVSSDIKAVEAYGDLANLMQFEQDLRADFDEQSHIPAQAFGRQTDIPRTPVSGVAIRLGYGPLMADITRERRTYGALIRRVTQRVLALKNPAWGEATVTLNWQDPLPSDDLQQAQVVQALLTGGVMSKQTGAEKSGLDWDVEQERMREEAQQSAADVLHGQALPPAPLAPAQPGQPLAPPEQPSDQQASLGSASAPPVNHPAAIAARQRMQAVNAPANVGAKTPTKRSQKQNGG